MGIFTREVERDDDDKFRAASYNAHRPITAAAQQINISDKTEISSISKRRAAAVWQDTAWDYYDLIGEIKFSANLIGSVMSRIRLYAGYITDEDTAPSHISDIVDLDKDLIADAQRAMRLLGTGNGGTPGLLKDTALNLFIAGECYLVQEKPRLGSKERERWTVRSIDEIVTRSSGRNAGMFIKKSRTATTGDLKPLSPGSAVSRIWNMHPRYSDEADSSMLGLLELCDELLLLAKTSRGTAKSRLNAGILLMPDDLANADPGDGEIDDDPETMAMMSDDDGDSFEETFEAAMVTPIADEGSAASVSPLVVRGPMDALNAVRHLTFERSFDKSLVERADRVMDRILAGLDIPKEIVQGVGDAKYANALQVEESLYKAHIEPLALLICDNFTDAFLKPVLRAYGWTEDQLERIVIWYDPSAITSKPSKAEAATVGFGIKTVSGEAWRRSHGFSKSDAPTELEIGQRLAVERGLLSEPVTEALLRTLIPELLATVREGQLANSPDGGVVSDYLGQTTASQEPATSATEEPAPPGLLEP